MNEMDNNNNNLHTMEQSVQLLYPKTPYQQDTLKQIMELVCNLPLKPETVQCIQTDLKYEPINPLLQQIRDIDSKITNTTPPPYIK